MSPEKMYVFLTSDTIDAYCLANMCKSLVWDCSSELPGEMNVWLQRVWSKHPKERLNIGELVKILEKLQENGPSPSPSVLDGRTDLTHQPSIKSPQCQGENICQDSPKKDSKRKRAEIIEDEVENKTSLNQKCEDRPTKNTKRKREEEEEEEETEASTSTKVSKRRREDDEENNYECDNDE
ncbi:hypothetical protein OTU49_014493 [Cherax quadricarinatus]|uniref:Uncharacterized protein n=1 Tax=Cherax quadricarinatus TaxID=27406 RepID=A0AAW0VQN4_CHEQU